MCIRDRLNGAITTFNTTQAHGLVVGNKFRVLNSSDVNLGDFVVESVGSVTQFTATTTSALTDPKYILKHGLSDNEALSSKAGENLSVRGLSIFNHEELTLNESSGQVSASSAQIQVLLPDGTFNAKSIINRFPLGSYIQIGGEIMRVASNTVTSQKISVIRGALGTIVSTHPNGSKIKKIKPIPIELRRPSILRASGHTFEYVGYGPGNYSTALPQLQNRSLSEREEFLTQSQETSCGNVVYTGMNDKGDFYIGNTKIASASGQQTTFDIPIPTVTGEDPNRLSIVADEVVVKERLLVEGGTSKQILSQFDGPVTFNENVRLANENKSLTVNGEIKVASTGSIRLHSDNNATSSTAPSGALFTFGGIGIGKDIVVGGNIVGDGASNLSGFNNVTATAFFGDGAGLTNTGASLTESTSNITERVVLTDKTSGTMTTAKTDAQLTFNFSTNKLTCGGGFVGNLTGDVTGNADSASTSANLSFGSANQVVFKNSSNNGATSANLTFDGTTLSGTALEIQVNDSKAVKFGSDSDMSISHDNTNGGINCGKGDLIIKAGSNNGDGVIIQTGTTHIAKFEKHSSTGVGNFELLYNGQTRIISQSWGTEIKNGELRVTGNDIIAFYSSDINLKENLQVIPNALDKVLQLRGVTYKWKDTTEGGTCVNNITETRMGVIAQEVVDILPEVVTHDKENDRYGVSYGHLTGVLIEAVKELFNAAKKIDPKL